MSKHELTTQTIPSPPSWRLRIVLLVLVALLATAAGVLTDWWWSVPEDAVATYVGRQSCVQCHQTQAELFHGSHHDLAMDVATTESVLGDFNDATLTHHDITSRMFTRDGRFMIHTEGPDGRMADFEIKYVFGVEPLQQYMVEFDRPADMPDNEIARLQVLRVSWDTQRKEWFYLPPPDVEEKLAPSDDLHWTGIAQRWNTMCADCHSTNLQKNYDVASNVYHTTFSEIDVSCEACHGPGSIHVQLAESKSLFWDRTHGYGLPHLKSDDTLIEIQSCAPCHSRRRIVHPDFRPGSNYYDHFDNELLGPLTYHADGQILDEVYVYGSFIQSKMYHKAIRCTDCHDPHSARLKYQGNQVCTSCHQHSAGKYDSPAHHFHLPESKGASCVECHMPESIYMEVDARRDHSLRIPRPDLSVQLGTPNACTRCHLDSEKISPEKRPQLKQYNDWIRLAREGDAEIAAELRRLDEWAAEATDRWYGQTPAKQEMHFGVALDAARERGPEATELLAKLARNQLQPPIARATALAEMAQNPAPVTLNTTLQLLTDESPQVRAAAIAALEPHLPSVGSGTLRNEDLAMLREQIGPLVKPLIPRLSDPVRLVRTEAARVLTHVPQQLMPSMLDGRQREAMSQALEEYRAGVLVNADRAGAHMTLAILAEQLGRDRDAQSNYETAIRVEPNATGPRSNLAVLLERQAEQMQPDIQRAAQARQRERAIQLLDRQHELRMRADALRRDELPLLARDAELVPDSAMVQHRYGLALYLQNRMDEAQQALEAAHRLEPDNDQFTFLLALFYQKIENYEKALPLARQLSERHPDNPQYSELLNAITQQQAAKAGEQ